MSITRPEAQIIDDFLRAVRWRLWVKLSLQSGNKIIAHTGIVLLALAGIHFLIIPVPLTLTITITAGAFLLILLRAFLQQPALSTSAEQADRVFNGHALMTTAEHYLHESTLTDNPAPRLVLRQACDAAHAWRPKLAAVIRSSRSSVAPLTIITLFIAFVILSLPGAHNSSDTSLSVAPDTRIDVRPDDSSANANTDDVSQLRSLFSRETPTKQLSADAAKTVVPFEHAATDAATTDPLAIKIPESNAGIAGAATDNSDASDFPGNAIPRSSPKIIAQEPARIQNRQTVDLQRTGRDMSASSGQDAVFAVSSFANATAALSALPAAPPESGPQWSRLSQAQAAYARRYLAASGKTNDGT